MNENLIPNAQVYAARHQLVLGESPGSGKDGIILVARRKEKPGESVIKLLKEPDGYHREKRVYERLREAGVRTILGFNVPQLLGFRTICS